MISAIPERRTLIPCFTNRFFSFLLILVVSTGSAATTNGYEQAVNKLLENPRPPIGIVFEVVSRDEAFLEKALPEISRLIKKLHQRFPDLDVVMVTHGREMFSLTKTSQQKNPKVKNRINSLLADDVTVHVCGTYAEWKGVDPSDFPESINVSAEGPAQIEDYVSLGYTLIKITRIE